jgi:hypothetical protein
MQTVLPALFSGAVIARRAVSNSGARLPHCAGDVCPVRPVDAFNLKTARIDSRSPADQEERDSMLKGALRRV